MQVFLFLANEKGASWAYSTPGFGAALAPAHLKMLRQMAMPDLDEAAKVSFCLIRPHTVEACPSDKGNGSRAWQLANRESLRTAL